MIRSYETFCKFCRTLSLASNLALLFRRWKALQQTSRL